MTNPICLSPLRFYDNVAKQNHRKSYAFGHVVPLLTKAGFIPPFQFVISATSGTTFNIRTVKIYDAKTDKLWDKYSGNIAEILKNQGLEIITIDNYSVVWFPGIFPLDSNSFEGTFYLSVEVKPTSVVRPVSGNSSSYSVDLSPKTFYSEVFCFTNNLDDCLEIEYWNPENDFYLKDGVVSLKGNHHFKIFLKTEIGKPDYSFEEEVTQRLGYSFIESQVSKKAYQFNVVVPEFICDALRLVKLCSNKIIRSKGEEYEAITFDMDADWQTQGDLASVTCEFEVDNIITNLGGYKHIPLGGDYNNSYNGDYDTE